MISESAEVQAKSAFLVQASERAREMLDTVEVMFDHAIVSIWLGAGDTGARQSVFSMDRGVDAAQTDIRQSLLMHLAANPGRDTAACLALMVVAKDAERAGDYCKNLTELAELAHTPLGATKYGRQLAATFSEVKRLFAPAQAVLNDPATTLLRLLMMRSSDLEEQCSLMIRQIANDSDLSENEAVCLALSFRGCRRISAHLANTACAAAGLLYGTEHHPLAAAKPPVSSECRTDRPRGVELMEIILPGTKSSELCSRHGWTKPVASEILTDS